MNTTILRRLCIILALFLTASVAPAEGFYAFYFSGVSYETNSAGVIQRHRVTQQTLLQEIAQRANLPNTSGMMLAYHVNGNDLGDTIDVINPDTGAILDSFIGLYFGQSFARVGLTNAVGSEVKRIDYVYTKQDAHSMGAAFVNIKRVGKAPTSNSPIFVSGTLDYCWAPQNGEHTRIYSGSFRTGKQLRF